MSTEALVGDAVAEGEKTIGAKVGGGPEIGDEVGA